MNLKHRDYRRALWQLLSFLLFPVGFFLLATSVYSLFNLTEIVRLSALVMHAVVFQDWTASRSETAGHLLGGLTWISHASEASARRNPEFESIINVLQEVGPRPEENSLFFGLPVRYRACAISN